MNKMRSNILFDPLPESLPSIYSAFYCTRHFGKNAKLRIFSVWCSDPNVVPKRAMFAGRII